MYWELSLTRVIIDFSVTEDNRIVVHLPLHTTTLVTMSSRRRVDKRTPEEKAEDKLKYHEDHHVTVKKFREHTHNVVKALKARDRLAKALYKNGSGTILSWRDISDPRISYTYTFAQLKADSDFLYRSVAELSDYHRLSKSRPGAKSSANTTPTAIGPVLRQFLFDRSRNGNYGPILVPEGINGLTPGSNIIDLLPFAANGFVLRSTLLEAFYLYAWHNRLDDPNDGRRLRIDALMNAVFNGTEPALFTKTPTGAFKEKRNDKGEVTIEYKYERAPNPNGLNTVQAILAYKPDYHPRWDTAFGEGRYMGSSDFQILSALNYYSSAESRTLVQGVLDGYAARGESITAEQFQQALANEYEILRTVRKYHKAIRDANPERQAAKKAKNEASKLARKNKPKTGAVVVDLGNGQSMVQYVAPQPMQQQVVSI